MYLFFGIFFLILLFFFCFNFWRKKKIIKKICCMSTKEKCCLLDELIEPFGFCYVASQDIFTSHINAMQREFGYCSLYDKAALTFHMVFDCMPVYFNYDDRTWLIELWKGQYGINTGGEIGLYYADDIVPESRWEDTLFHSVENKDMAGLSFNLFRKGIGIADVGAKHWWLTAFSVGRFSNPEDLYMRAAISFPHCSMAEAFVEGLVNTGYCRHDISICHNTVTFSFTKSFMKYGCLRRLRIRLVQRINRFWCSVYLFVTRPFCLSLDKILYLYYYLPFVFRKILRVKKYKKRKIKRR